MDTNTEMNLVQWVDDRVASLSPESTWEPDVTRALARFNERCRAPHSFGRRWAWALAATVAACVFLLALPASREFGLHLWRSPYLQIVNVGQVSAAGVTLRYGQAAPDFTLQGAGGDDIRLSAFKGQVVLLNFWATWCPACRTEIPWLREFENKYGGKGLAIVGVSMDDAGWKAVIPFVAENQVNYPVVIGNDGLAKSYGLTAMPMTYLIDRDGNIAATSVGLVDQSACEREILQLLAK
jgi:peroxiredoxin